MDTQAGLCSHIFYVAKKSSVIAGNGEINAESLPSLMLLLNSFFPALARPLQYEKRQKLMQDCIVFALQLKLSYVYCYVMFWRRE